MACFVCDLLNFAEFWVVIYHKHIIVPLRPNRSVAIFCHGTAGMMCLIRVFIVLQWLVKHNKGGATDHCDFVPNVCQDPQNLHQVAIRVVGLDRSTLDMAMM